MNRHHMITSLAKHKIHAKTMGQLRENTANSSGDGNEGDYDDDDGLKFSPRQIRSIRNTYGQKFERLESNGTTHERNIEYPSTSKGSTEQQSEIPGPNTSIQSPKWGATELLTENSKGSKEFLEVVHHCIKKAIDADTIILLGNQEFRCHHVALQTYSSFFKKEQRSRDKMMEIRLPEDIVQPVFFPNLIDWIIIEDQKKKQVINRDNVVGLFSAACYLGIPTLKKDCMNFIKIKVEAKDPIILKMYEEASKNPQCAELLSLLSTKLGKFFPKLHDMAFLQMNVTELCILLDSESLNIKSEMEVCDAAVRWLVYEWSMRSHYTFQVMSTVRFGLLSPVELTQIQFKTKQDQLPNYEKIFAHPEVKAMVENGFKYAIWREKYKTLPNKWLVASGIPEPRPRHKLTNALADSNEEHFSNPTKKGKTKKTSKLVFPEKKAQSKPTLRADEGNNGLKGAPASKEAILSKMEEQDERDRKLFEHCSRSLARIGKVRRTICVTFCQFSIVKKVARKENFSFVDERDDWEIMWTDTPFTDEQLGELRRIQDSRVIFDDQPTFPLIQKLNHFPGMNQICRKDRLARNLKRMKSYFPKDYDFFPETWTLPTDLAVLIDKYKNRKDFTFICKPDTGAQGRGIFLVHDLKLLKHSQKMICQVYIPRPFLIGGYKFDLRIYALVTSVHPLRIYMFDEGIVRFATVQYSPPNNVNLDIVYMHLTNYSLNKFSQSYTPEHSKRKLSLIYEWMSAQGLNVVKLKADIDGIVVKTMISAHAGLKHYYKIAFPKLDHGCLCFEVLGFDILIDENMKPFLLEVNHSPSYNLDLPIDTEIKGNLIRDTLSKIYLGGSPLSDAKKRHGRWRAESPSLRLLRTRDLSGCMQDTPLQRQFRHEAIHGLNYRLIYPSPNNQSMYAEFLTQANLEPFISDIEKEDD